MLAYLPNKMLHISFCSEQECVLHQMCVLVCTKAGDTNKISPYPLTQFRLFPRLPRIPFDNLETEFYMSNTHVFKNVVVLVRAFSCIFYWGVKVVLLVQQISSGMIAWAAKWQLRNHNGTKTEIILAKIFYKILLSEFGKCLDKRKNNQSEKTLYCNCAIDFCFLDTDIHQSVQLLVSPLHQS